MKEKCCPVMTVESATDESKNEMYALLEEVPWSQAKKENCSSNCAYVKMKELNNLMEEMMNMTNMDSEENLENMQMLLGKEQMEEIKMNMKINRLQKYCFAPTDKDMQSMCAVMSDVSSCGFVLFGECVIKLVNILRICLRETTNIKKVECAITKTRNELSKCFPCLCKVLGRVPVIGPDLEKICKKIGGDMEEETFEESKCDTIKGEESCLENGCFWCPSLDPPSLCGCKPTRGDCICI